MKRIVDYIFPLLAGVFLVLWLQQCNKDPEVRKVVVERKIPVPVYERVYDTIRPEPKTRVIKEIDSSLYDKYKKLKDSIQKDSAYKQAIAIREYDQVFEDSVQKINVFSKTRGELLEQSLSYKTKPRDIIVRDTFVVPTKTKFNIGGGLGFPLGDPTTGAPVLKADLMIINKKGNTFSVSYDTNGTLWATKTLNISKNGKN